MDFSVSTFFGENPVVGLILLIIALIVVMAILRYVINIATSLFRTAMWIGVLIILLYVVYWLLRTRLA